MVKLPDKKVEMLQQEWEMDSLSYKFPLPLPCDLKRELYASICKMKLKCLKDSAKAEYDMYDNIEKLFKRHKV